MSCDPLHEHPDHRGCVFRALFDVAVYGAGWAGVVAALDLAERGSRVLLVAPDAAFAWESGWALADDAAEGGGPGWGRARALLDAGGAVVGGRVDGAIAEIAVAARLARGDIATLAYVRALAVERDAADAIAGVIVGGKGGVRRLRARRWVDATDGAELARLCVAASAPRPAMRRAYIHLRDEAWRDAPDVDVLPGARLRAGGWPNQRTIELSLADGEAMPVAMLRALAAVRALGGAAATAVVSHVSVAPLAAWNGGAAPAGLPRNLAPAVAAWHHVPIASLAARAELGAGAARACADLPGGDAIAAGAPIALPSGRALTSGIAVAGLGTGGALAALAAARAGAQVIGLEPLPFCGGIGAGGGIHWYYYGVKGGLQEEVDARVHAIQPLFAPPGSIQGFHPDAKKTALGLLLDEAGVARRHGAIVVAATREGRRVADALVATPDGPLRVAAPAWIDGTGDGDLVALVGARTRYGRAGDGLPHAYTQSGGRCWTKDGGATWMGVVNFDAGFTDPRDAEDLTRARLHGLTLLRQERYEAGARPTSCAPALGLRQGRHIVAEYDVTLDDLITRRRFPDSVGRTGSHYDNHATDYEFESDEGLFWVWACRQWQGRTACDIPYRAIVPADLDNAWVACRAFGVENDAHFSMRMQRDVQRAGEVAGIAAAVATTHAVAARDVPYAALVAALRASGALAPADGGDGEDAFGPRMVASDFAGDEAADTAALARDAEGGYERWRLYRRGQRDGALRESVAAALADAHAAWNAATLLAMWGDARAQPRLCAAIAERESGYRDDEERRPQTARHLAPRWRVAISLLRRCGDEGCADTLAALADKDPPFNARTAIALAIAAIADRIGGARAAPAFTPIVERLMATPCADAVGAMQRNVELPPAGPPGPTDRRIAREDFTWQLEAVVGRARRALGLAMRPELLALADDPRATVRAAARAQAAPAANPVGARKEGDVARRCASGDLQ
ncbi:MAG TPA: FAD-dependent oxidoreductase [Planctomycetota bacterium]|nr:FAD-dependent oxidoreductase [Planctomycetota bacterium]